MIFFVSFYLVLCGFIETGLDTSFGVIHSLLWQQRGLGIANTVYSSNISKKRLADLLSFRLTSEPIRVKPQKKGSSTSGATFLKL